MKNDTLQMHDQNAKQRLVDSRRALLETLNEPLWSALVRGFIQRQVQKLDQHVADEERRKLKKLSDLAASGRIPS